MKRHLLGLMGAAGAVMLWIACAEDPTGAIRGGIARVTPSATYAEVVVGDSSTFSVRAVDGQGNPLPILPTVTVADASVAAVTVDQASSGNPLPQTNFRVRGVSFGSTTITMTAGGRSAQMTVQTLPQLIEITAPASLRSGETATISAQAVDATGAPVAGVPITLSVDDETILAFDEGTLEIEAILVGVAVISAVGPAGETGGVPVAEGESPVTVLAGPPAAAELGAVDFGAVGAAGTSTLEVVITDANGNVNNKVEEITNVTAMSSNDAVATVMGILSDSVVVDIDTGEPVDTIRRVLVEVTGVAAGSVDVTATVETTEGNFDIGPAPATVLNPIITAAAPSGGFGSTITINGSGFVSAGFLTSVLVDGMALGNITIVSDAEIEAQMPTFDVGGTFDLQVDVGGVASNADAWTQTDDFDEDEPNNDTVGTEPLISFPFNITGVADPAEVVQEFGHYDLYHFVLGQDGTINVDLDWDDGGNDVDVYIWDFTLGQPDGSFATFPTGWECGAAGGTLGKPEGTGDCELPAGDYLIWIYDFGPGTSNYNVTGSFTPTP